ncbi:IS3 family transposase [Thomasclavelia spiroformis]|uniref:IS3 family transposase n=1 Tax=Thomasclavelia spiroformis TaxID=29348 RepID=UPI0032EA0758
MSKKDIHRITWHVKVFFGRLKNEFCYHRNWVSIITEDFIRQLNEYIMWYNFKRIKSSLGLEYKISPTSSFGCF